MKSSLTIVKIVLTVASIVSIGTALGAIGYVASIKKNPPVVVQPTPTITSVATVKPTKTPIIDCPSEVKDIDNNIYKTVQIGSQCWMKENLKVTKNPQGEAITRYCYDNDPNICNTDGGLYDWNTAMNNSTQEGAPGICPNGWHVPKDSEWYVLENNLATNECLNDRAYDANGEPWSDEKNERISWGCDPAGKSLKIDGLSGFMAILGGIAAYHNVNLPPNPPKEELYFRDRGEGAIFWSSTGTYDSAWIRSLDSTHSKIYRGSHYGGSIYSVRCLKN